MTFSRKAALTSTFAAQCLIAGLAGPAPAQAAGIPDYFFKEWTVSTNCTEQNAGLAAQVQTGLKFKISKSQAAADGTYVFEAEDTVQQHWAANWNGIKLEYRPGTKMTTVPADFECIPSQETASPFLTMSGYAVAAEPYYQEQHWYGIAKIHGQVEHVLIFPRAATDGGASAVIVLQSVNAAGTVQLDDNGVIHAQ